MNGHGATLTCTHIQLHVAHPHVIKYFPVCESHTMQSHRPHIGAAAHPTPLFSLQHPAIRANARSYNHTPAHMVSLRALHLHSSSSANRHPPETPEEGGTAPGTSSVAQMQQQRSGVGDAVWTVWSGTQHFAGNILSAWSSREPVDNNSATSTSVASSSAGRAKLLKDAAERGKKVCIHCKGWVSHMPSQACLAS